MICIGEAPAVDSRLSVACCRGHSLHSYSVFWLDVSQDILKLELEHLGVVFDFVCCSFALPVV